MVNMRNQRGQIFYGLLRCYEGSISIGFSEFVTRPGVSKSKIVKLEVIYRPTKPEQTAIAEVLTDMDAELAALEQRREKTHALKQGMMQELLTGRTRLV